MLPGQPFSEPSFGLEVLPHFTILTVKDKGRGFELSRAFVTTGATSACWACANAPSVLAVSWI
jgi:hypothetical protein